MNASMIFGFYREEKKRELRRHENNIRVWKRKMKDTNDKKLQCRLKENIYCAEIKIRKIHSMGIR